MLVRFGASIVPKFDRDDEIVSVGVDEIRFRKSRTKTIENLRVMSLFMILM